MTENIDEHFVRLLGEAPGAPAAPPRWSADRTRAALGRLAERTAPEEPSDSSLLALLDAQVMSRRLDLAARVLQSEGEGFYTIASSGHESNAAIALALRPTDPALLHYRSGGFYCARAGQVPHLDPVADMVRSLTASVDDPISGGRHKVFGHSELSIIPQTSTIASHLPRAVGLAFALGRAEQLGVESAWPGDAVVVTSLGDASLNHSTAIGALNSAGQLAHQGAPVPLVVVVEDNGLGISVRSPAGWVSSVIASRPGLTHIDVDGTDPEVLLSATAAATGWVRRTRRPLIIHLHTVRFMGHAGSDAEVAYRTPSEIEADHARDPLLATARSVIARGLRTPEQVLERYAAMGTRIRDTAVALRPVRHLATAGEVADPLVGCDPGGCRREAVVLGGASTATRSLAFRGSLPEERGPLTLAQSLNAALTDLMVARRNVIAFGEDVSRKGGVYGVTRGLRKAFGVGRVFDTMLDEQTILGAALGSALAGFLPVPEIQYLAYVHNAEDQIRGEAATLRFFSTGQYENGMIIRIAGLAYQRGFGGHFHNDNSLAVFRDIPGVVVAVPSSAAEAPGLVRALAGMAVAEGRVCILLEPIALYHTRDLEPGDNAWTFPYAAPSNWADNTPTLGETRLHGEGHDTLVVTFGNGVAMSLRAAAEAEREASERGIPAPSVSVLDLRWLAPLPTEDLLRHAARFRRVLVVDETRRSGGVSEGIVTALVDGGCRGSISRVCSEDSIIPLGPAAYAVLLREEQIVAALLADKNHDESGEPL